MRKPFSARALNRRSILVTLLRLQPISRVRLARETGLSTTTVTNIVADLMRRGLVQEAGIDEKAPRLGAGRPPVALSVVPESGYAFGIHIGVRWVRIALVDLQANVVEFDAFSVDPEQSAKACMAQIAATCRTMADRMPKESKARIVGVGVGASGVVRASEGVNVVAPSQSWRNAPLRDLLESELEWPVIVDNNVRCMALGEGLFGVGSAATSLAFVYARMNVGSGLVIEGDLYRGSDFGAGEIGHWVMQTQAGALCSCGNRGCLETLISEQVLLERAAEIDRDLLTGRANPLQTLFDAARDGHLGLVEMIEERAYWVGLAMANLVNIVNPQMIVMGGWLSDAFDLVTPVIESTIHSRAFGGTERTVRILPSSYGRYCGVVGGAALAFDEFLFAPALTHTPEGEPVISD